MIVRVGLALLTTGCSAQPGLQNGAAGNVQGPVVSPAPVETMLLRSDGEVQHVARGQRFGVTLEIHPSVGFNWELTDTTGGIRVGGVIEPDFSNVPPGGDRGDRTFRFVATEPGPATLRFVHLFRGEKREEVTFRLVVTG